MKGHFSDTLIEEITSAIALGEQVILFQNRRGYSPLEMHDLWARTHPAM
jgi:primosomal protein N' (replication factor Y)